MIEVIGSILLLASILTGEASGCTVEAKVDVAYVVIHREDAGIKGGWAAIADVPSSEDVAIAFMVYSAVLGNNTDPVFRDRYPHTLYAISEEDMRSGKLYWLNGKEPTVWHTCDTGSHEEILF